MNAAGKDFVENTLLGSVVRDADLLQSLPKSLAGKLERAIPSLIELGQRNDAWNILPEVREAIQQVTSAQACGMSVKDQLAQSGLFGETGCEFSRGPLRSPPLQSGTPAPGSQYGAYAERPGEGPLDPSQPPFQVRCLGVHDLTSYSVSYPAWYIEHFSPVNPVLQGKCHIRARNPN